MQPNLIAISDRLLECPICFGPHNDEIHDASLSIRSWFRADVLRRMEQPVDIVAGNLREISCAAPGK
jgi:hypothetical protein